METLQAIFPARDYSLLAAIILLPLLGAIVNGIFGKRLGKEAVTLMALASVGASFVGSVLTFFLLKAQQTGTGAVRFSWTAWHWLSLSFGEELDFLRSHSSIQRLNIDVAFSVDALSGTMALIVTGVGFLIHLYSTKYMDDDEGYHRFFCYLNLFIFAMLVLIFGDSLPILFIGWEGVGLCSYLLIGYWYSDEVNAAAGKKAFITNRIGDFGLIVAMALLVKYTGALSWTSIQEGAPSLLRGVTVWQVPWLFQIFPSLATHEWARVIVGPHQVTVATLVGLAVFLGCAGKSAQIPLYVWLPDAMAGPTPVSALIHAATMVTAGVYLVCRMAPIFVLSPAAMFIVALIGALTAVFAATIAFAQNDIKKVLAYSTVSQLGYMFLGVGVGAFVAGFFHVITHAFFKACLFLAAGSVIHAMHARIHDSAASQDVRFMGGLKDFLPTTHWTFLASTVAIAGLPFTSGFYSKDAILLGALTSKIKTPIVQTASGPMEVFTWPTWGPKLLFGLGVLGAVMTAFYMGRLYILTFQGQFRGWKVVTGWKPPEHEHEVHEHQTPHSRHVSGPEPHESPWQMTVPLVILGTLALVGGLLNAHLLFHWDFMDQWLAPVFADANKAVEAVEDESSLKIVLGLAVSAFLFGGLGAYFVYIKQEGEPAREFTERFPGLHQWAIEKWRIDEFYDEFIIGTIDFIADVFVWIDKWVVDGIIARLTSWLIAATGHLLRLFQTGRVQAYAAVMMIGTAAVGWFLTAPHAFLHVDADHNSGKYSVSAASGLGYAYRWDADGDGKFDSEEFGESPKVDVALKNGEQRHVKLEVKNAFGRIATKTIDIMRPNAEPQAQSASDVSEGQQGAENVARALQKVREALQ